MLSMGSKDNPITNISCNWDIVLIFDVLKRSLGLFDHSFQRMCLILPNGSGYCMSAFHLLHEGMSFLAILLPERIYFAIKSTLVVIILNIPIIRHPKSPKYKCPL